MAYVTTWCPFQETSTVVRSFARLSQSNELPPRLKHTIFHIPPIQSALNCLATCHWASWHYGGSGGEWTWVGCQQLDQRPPGRRIGHSGSIDVLREISDDIGESTYVWFEPLFSTGKAQYQRPSGKRRPCEPPASVCVLLPLMLPCIVNTALGQLSNVADYRQRHPVTLLSKWSSHQLNTQAKPGHLVEYDATVYNGGGSKRA